MIFRRRLPHPATDLRAVYSDPDPQLAVLRRRDARPTLLDIAEATRGGVEGVRDLLERFPREPRSLGGPSG